MTSVTATRVCTNDTTHVETEKVATTSSVTKEPTTTEKGTKEFTAVFTNPAFETQTKTLDIPALDSGITYSVEKGANSTWTKGSESSVVVVIKRLGEDAATFRHFTGIRMDNVDVAKDKYGAESGSVVLTLPASYMETLSVGDHTLTAMFDDGSVDTQLTVKSAESNTTPENKDDTGNTEKTNNADSTSGTSSTSGESAGGTDQQAQSSSQSSGTAQNASAVTKTTSTATAKTADTSTTTLAASLAGIAFACLAAAVVTRLHRT